MKLINIQKEVQVFLTMVQHNFKLYKLVLAALFTALIVVISRFFIFPVPITHGNVNLCDAGIFIVAFILGPIYGGVVGGLSGFLLDLISGYSQYMFFSLIIHGLEGLIVGWLFYHYLLNNKKVNSIIAMIIGAVIMVIGYFLTDMMFYGVAAGLVSLITNSIQGLLGIIVASLIIPQLCKISIINNLIDSSKKD